MEHQIEIDVRYYETDGQGVVHHANYFQYFELARVEMLKAMGHDDTFIRGVVIRQGMIYAALGVLPALPLSLALYTGLQAATNLPMVMTVLRVALVTALALVMSIGAAANVARTISSARARRSAARRARPATPGGIVSRRGAKMEMRIRGKSRRRTLPARRENGVNSTPSMRTSTSGIGSASANPMTLAAARSAARMLNTFFVVAGRSAFITEVGLPARVAPSRRRERR